MKNVSICSFDFFSKSISNCDPSSECEENRLELKKTKYSSENRDIWFTLIPSISYSKSNERKNSLQKTSQTSIANILIHSNICTFLFPSKPSLLSFKEFSRSTKKLRPFNLIFGHYWLFYSLISVTILARSIETVRINSISRPQSFRYGTLNEVILDCDFTIDDQDELLIVKWFLNDDAQHIYQWIQSPDVRTYSDRIKPYVDEKFVVKDYQTRHRALRLINPPISLSGKYTCSVSSLQNEDNNSTHLVIYGRSTLD
ncbi:tyrosine-tRNA ligase [Sarcoptes scabiei]|nr:tyrosine-tRNA ligase [Sarcoptes scabiei]